MCQTLGGTSWDDMEVNQIEVTPDLKVIFYALFFTKVPVDHENGNLKMLAFCVVFEIFQSIPQYFVE